VKQAVLFRSISARRWLQAVSPDEVIHVKNVLADFDSWRCPFLSICVATMRRYLLILIFAVLFQCAGCQVVTNHVKESFANASDDYQRMTTGSNSSYIASQRSQR
jgi:hypothetical protein